MPSLCDNHQTEKEIFGRNRKNRKYPVKRMLTLKLRINLVCVCMCVCCVCVCVCVCVLVSE